MPSDNRDQVVNEYLDAIKTLAPAVYTALLTLNDDAIRQTTLARQFCEAYEQVCDQANALRTQVSALRQQLADFREVINHDGSLETHEEHVDTLCDAMHAFRSYGKVVAENERLESTVSALRQEAAQAVANARVRRKYIDAAAAARREAETLRGQLDAAQEDTERLNWLDAKREPIASPDGTELIAYGWGVIEQQANVRDAIDAARVAAPREPKND